MQQFIDFAISTEEVAIKNNNLPEGSFNIVPKYTRLINRNDSAKRASVTLSVEILGTEAEPFPVDVRIVQKGTFNMEKIPAEQIDEFLKYNAVQVLFPYLRTTLSTSLSAAMMPPIVLPIIDVQEAFDNNA